MCSQSQSCSWCPQSPSGDINYYELIIYLSYCLVNQVLELHTSGEVSAGIKGEGLHLATNHYLYFIGIKSLSLLQDNHLRFECHCQLYLCILSH